MSKLQEPISAVPTNIITGFLGVGKTSAILNLMRHKPENERWAILVNEFGEIGVDGSLLEGSSSEGQQVYIREVPGGCMCCAAGLPMQIALNQLLTHSRPDRLLIEPTGLGHPKEVLEVLSSENYREVLSLQKIITLVDARKLSEPKYTEHDTFNQQIDIADIVVGNKTDLYATGDDELLSDYVSQRANKEGTPVVYTIQGDIHLALLDGETASVAQQSHHHHHHHTSKPLASELPIPPCGYIKAVNSGEGFESVGWRFAPNKVFSRQKLIELLVTIEAERLKAVFITQDGVFGYNMTSDELQEGELDDCKESRIEIIASTIDSSLEEKLLNCLV